jgi:hypothetical protein
MKEYDYEILSMEQLDEFQQFYCDKGLCHVIQILDHIGYYECEILEPHNLGGQVFYLEIGDKISLT